MIAFPFLSFSPMRADVKKYADVGHVMHISGNNFLTGMEAITDVFFKYPHSWGWATGAIAGHCTPSDTWQR